ncbi:hypothetical protein CGMCC3_g15604 [Colletotrichum fructicola]|nr:uncharacterized protein CGMCC3_g15604 [Colletotrichum fructicola]KAE9568319.1 hypothetical protein CGMCC3_g15604 [Colletotrichum fructicola]
MPKRSRAPPHPYQFLNYQKHAAAAMTLSFFSSRS